MRSRAHSRMRALLASAELSGNGRRRRGNYQPILELLEDRTLPAVLSGTVINDLNADGARGPDDPGLANRTLFLDGNANEVFDLFSETITVTAPAENLALRPGPFGLPSAPLFVPPDGSPPLSEITDFELQIDVENTGADSSVLVVLLTPEGAKVGAGPALFFLNSGDSLNVTIDDDAGQSIGGQSGEVSGTFSSLEPFAGSSAFVFGGDPNGTYNLVFVPFAGGTEGITINSLSLSFTVPERTTVTEDDGSYTFADVEAGEHRVGLLLEPLEAQTFPTGDSLFYVVNVAQSDVVTGLDFGIQGAPDLVGNYFKVEGSSRQAGDEITVEYVVTNQAAGPADAFEVAIVLATDGAIDGNDTVLATQRFESLGAFSSLSSTATFVLPDVERLTDANALIGLVIDSQNEASEGNESNNFGIRAGRDFDFLQPFVNQALTDGGTQHHPSIAVNPNDSNHIAIAYVDYDLVDTGYAGIGVKVSTDGGKTFQTSEIPLPDNFDQGAAYPSVAFDANGTLYVSFMAASFFPLPFSLQEVASLATLQEGAIPGETYPFNGLGGVTGPAERFLGLLSNNGVFVAKSAGGSAWDVTAVTENFADLQDDGVTPKGFTPFFDASPDLGIDTEATLLDGSANLNFGKVYVAFSRFYAPGQYPGLPDEGRLFTPPEGVDFPAFRINGGAEAYVAVSTDGGESYELQLDPDTGFTVLRDPATTSNDLPPGVSFDRDPQIHTARGVVAVSQFAGTFFSVYVSENGGTSFTIADRAGNVGLPFGPFQGFPTRTLSNGSFYTAATRQILIDPVRDGVIYALEALSVETPAGQLIDNAEVTFAVSTDNGSTWQQVFSVDRTNPNLDEIPRSGLIRVRAPLNDDNDGRFLRFAEDLAREVISGQALPSLAIDEDGNLAAIWYDTRRDPQDKNLDVFGTVSSDGGDSFSSNFRISTESFDPDLGSFIDAAGNENFNLGYRIGLALADGKAYAVWTDTRNGVASDPSGHAQDIFFASFGVGTPPTEAQDRFENNDTPQTATQLGRIVVPTVQNRLVMNDLDDDYFELTTAATGKLVVSVLAEDGGASLELQVIDDFGNTFVGTVVLDEQGNVIAKTVEIDAQNDQTFLAHVTGTSSERVKYSLTAQSLTADLGAEAQVEATGNLNGIGDVALYRYTAAVTGSLDVSLAIGAISGDIAQVEILAEDGVTVLASGFTFAFPSFSTTETLTVDVVEGQTLFIRVKGQNAAFLAPVASASFTLALTNHDQFTLPDDKTVLHRIETGTVAAGSPSLLIPFTVQATGTLRARLGLFAPGQDVRVEVLGEDGETVLASAQGGFFVVLFSGGSLEELAVDVKRGQQLSLRIIGSPENAGRSFFVEFSNGFDLSANGTASLFFPTVGFSSDVATGDLNNDGIEDVVVSSSSQADVINVLLGNPDGTFSSPQTYRTGAGLDAVDNREIAVVDVDEDNDLDVIVTNPTAASISVFLNTGNGVLEPDRRFDTVATTNFLHSTLDYGDFDGDGHVDVLTGQALGVSAGFSVLLGRGDGTFQPQTITPVQGFSDGLAAIRAGDFDQNGFDDVAVFGLNNSKAELFLSDGTSFTSIGTISTGAVAGAAEVEDVNGDGYSDLIIADADSPRVLVRLGDGQGGFDDPMEFFVGVDLEKRGTFSLTIGDFGSQITRDDGSTLLGPADETLDALVHLGPTVTSQGTAQIIFAAGLVDEDGNFAGFGEGQLLAEGEIAREIAVRSRLQGGSTVLDVVAAQDGGLRVVYDQGFALSRNDAPESARDLGVVTHEVAVKQSITRDKSEAFFTITVPAESISEAGDQVIDLSSGFDNDTLEMQVFDSVGALLGAGPRLRVVAPQGEVLTIRIFGKDGGTSGGTGTGTFSLVIDVLPQIAAVEAHALLPGGAPTTLAALIQGDRLNPELAEDPGNWIITKDGAALSGVSLTQIIYNPTANVDVTSGLDYPTRVKQTVTFVFDKPLPPGEYGVSVKNDSSIQSAEVFDGETASLTPSSGFNGHPVVNVTKSVVVEGGSAVVPVKAASPAGLGSISNGTNLLQQLYDDLGAELDNLLNELGDDVQGVTNGLLQILQDRLAPAIQGLGTRFLVLVLDPVSIDLADPQGARSTFSLRSNQVSRSIPQSYVHVGSNVELVLAPALTDGTFTLNVSDVPPAARGGALVFGGSSPQAIPLTAALRSGTTQFTFNFRSALPAVTSAALSPGASVASLLSAFTITGPRLAALINLAGSNQPGLAALNGGALDAATLQALLLTATLTVGDSPSPESVKLTDNSPEALVAFLTQQVNGVARGFLKWFGVEMDDDELQPKKPDDPDADKDKKEDGGLFKDVPVEKNEKKPNAKKGGRLIDEEPAGKKEKKPAADDGPMKDAPPKPQGEDGVAPGSVRLEDHYWMRQQEKDVALVSENRPAWLTEQEEIEPVRIDSPPPAALLVAASLAAGLGIARRERPSKSAPDNDPKRPTAWPPA